MTIVSIRRTAKHTLGLILALSLASPNRAHTQAKPFSVPSVVLREVHLDPLLLSFGLDSVQVRTAVADLLDSAGRLASMRTLGTPALDIALTVPRTVAGGDFGPVALLRIEVGRNLMENGSATKLVWESTMQFGELMRGPSGRKYLTWRSLADGVPSEITRAIGAFLSGQRAGA
jgi:hypothetical protein